MRQDLASWKVLSLGLCALFAGLALLGQFDVGGYGQVEKAALVRAQSLWMLALVAAVVPPVETFVWTLVPVEASIKYAGRPLWGGLFGVVAYGPVYHASGGMLAMLASTWLAVVLVCVYVYSRRNSFRVAFLLTLVIRYVFLAFALIAIRG